MRIGTYNMISQIYGNTGTKKTKTSGTTGSGSFLDQVSFAQKLLDSYSKTNI